MEYFSELSSVEKDIFGNQTMQLRHLPGGANRPLLTRKNRIKLFSLLASYLGLLTTAQNSSKTILGDQLSTLGWFQPFCRRECNVIVFLRSFLCLVCRWVIEVKLEPHKFTPWLCKPCLLLAAFSHGDALALSRNTTCQFPKCESADISPVPHKSFQGHHHPWPVSNSSC